MTDQDTEQHWNDVAEATLSLCCPFIRLDEEWWRYLGSNLHYNLYRMRRASWSLLQLIGVRGVDREDVVFRVNRRAMGEDLWLSLTVTEIPTSSSSRSRGIGVA